MGTVMFLACLLVTLMYYDVLLRVRVHLLPASAFRFLSRFQLGASHRILSLARVWGGFGLKLHRFAGRLPPKCVVISNHQSLADIPVLMQALPMLDLRFVAKRELRRFVPGVSYTLRAGRHALIGRHTGRREALRSLRKLAGLAALGVSPVIFPEGTRSRDGQVGEFHTAAFRTIAETTGLPILSVAVDGGLRISRLKGLARNLRLTRYRVQPLTLYPPASGREEVAHTLQAARREIAAQLDRWRSGADGA